MATSWLVGVAAWTESARDDAVATAACETHDTLAVAVVISLRQKVIVWHALLAPLDGFDSAEDAILIQFRVILDDLQWEHDRLRAEDVCIVDIQLKSASFAEELRCLAQERGHQVHHSSHDQLVDPDLMEESLEKLLQQRAATPWNRARELIGRMGFQQCVRTLYTVAAAGEAVLENPRLENSFEFTLQVHTQPVRGYLRLNDAARRMIQQQLPSLFRPLCRTKRGLRRLLDRIDRPETNATVLRRWHELLHELVHSGEECKTAIAELLDCVAAAESQVILDSVKSPTLEDLRVFCIRSRQLQASCQAFYQATTTSATPQLNMTLAPQLATVIDEVVMPFVQEVDTKIKCFDATASKTDQAVDLSVQSLRGQVRACERSIQAHRDEMAASLLLQPERIKIVFEDGDFSSAASKAAPVLFRVTRQDAHRVFKANATTTDLIAKKPRLSAEANAQDTAVTLVFSRRTTGVWFSSPRLDTLAVQWRTLHLEISRLESELVASLMEAYDRDIRAPLVEWMSLVSQLDILAAFTRLSTQFGFTRAETVEMTHTMEFVGLRWPREVPSTGTHTTATVGLDEANPLLVVHSAIGDDGSLAARAAVAVVLHQIGCFVPCSHAKLPLFDALFVRAGATDQTLANESTFLSEMQQMSSILTRATPRSLVLIDELCRGTSPAEGLPLAVEMCRFLAERRVFTCVSTQWTELLHALLQLGSATVPRTRTNQPAADKEVYAEQLFDCDQRFLSALYDHDFPTELFELVQSDL